MSADLDLSQFEGMTPGPWGWFGNAKHNSIYLAAKHSGRKFVMQFKRWGMGGAQPYFQPGSKGMVPASSLVKFEVGDVGVKGVDEAKQNATVYRFDITGIDCPDARAIAAVPDLIAEVKRLREENAELSRQSHLNDTDLPDAELIAALHDELFCVTDDIDSPGSGTILTKVQAALAGWSEASKDVERLTRASKEGKKWQDETAQRLADNYKAAVESGNLPDVP